MRRRLSRLSMILPRHKTSPGTFETDGGFIFRADSDKLHNDPELLSSNGRDISGQENEITTGIANSTLHNQQETVESATTVPPQLSSTTTLPDGLNSETESVPTGDQRQPEVGSYEHEQSQNDHSSGAGTLPYSSGDSATASSEPTIIETQPQPSAIESQSQLHQPETVTASSNFSSIPHIPNGTHSAISGEPVVLTTATGSTIPAITSSNHDGSLSRGVKQVTPPPSVPVSTSIHNKLPPISTISPPNHFRQNPPTRENSLSPLHEPGSVVESPRLSSPSSSLIFERSVQDFTIGNDDKIPSHYHSEDYIPPVLDASTTAITDSSLDPNMIEIVSLSPGSAARTRSISSGGYHHHSSQDENSPLPAGLSSPSQSSPTRSHLNQHQFNSNGTSTGSSGPNSSNGGLGLRNLGAPPVIGIAVSGASNSSKQHPTVSEGDGTANNHSNSIPVPQPASNSPSNGDRHVLSFCSFADIVTSEHTPHPNKASFSASSPSSPRSKPFADGFAGSPHSLRTIESAEALAGSEEFILAPEEFELEDDPGLVVRSMDETIRYNTGEITSQLA
ncbi:hypothetical protein AWJ20_4487 [Sugiyamaella lignohabitans]|uniref:Uncharacterized protein n=1 Tax=Sugiyamaella lignohabitans TaxID=796027 RepID=A0A167CGN3_9ASCO|nr:uncharacterized protein AWJ20_4487 [Sugiyamaella lignohabitans]ANB11666.1 hypothetical protein AWJ20_4487 [Sugiyamaella lignohabitans]